MKNTAALENNNVALGSNLRSLTVTGMLSAVSFVLMSIDFAVPFMPSFIKMDVSEFPALIGSFALGPGWGVAVCFIKNLIHAIFMGKTGGVGEISNFLLGAVFCAVAGMIYAKKKNLKGAIIASLSGALAMAVLSVPLNYFLVYPMYTSFMPMEAIVGAYQAIVPGVKDLLSALIFFNMPFTFVKGLLDVVITFLVYKRLSPILKGQN